MLSDLESLSQKIEHKTQAVEIFSSLLTKKEKEEREIDKKGWKKGQTENEKRERRGNN